MGERESERKIVLTPSQVLIILLLLVILMSVVFVLGISVGRRQKATSAKKIEELPPVVIKESEPVESPKIEEKETLSSAEASHISKLYFIQVGAFSSEASAQAFAGKFKDLNYPVKVLPPSIQDEKKVYRVRIGPYLKEEEAKEVLKKLKQTGKENYFIVSEEGR